MLQHLVGIVDGTVLIRKVHDAVDDSGHSDNEQACKFDNFLPLMAPFIGPNANLPGSVEQASVFQVREGQNYSRLPAVKFVVITLRT